MTTVSVSNYNLEKQQQQQQRQQDLVDLNNYSKQITDNANNNNNGNSNTNSNNNNNNNSFVPNQVDSELIEFRQICKLFNDLTISQKKKFISAFLNLFDEKLLRNLNLSIESLNHNDFDYQFSNKRNAQQLVNGKIAARSTKSFLVGNKRVVSTLPTIKRTPTIYESSLSSSKANSAIRQSITQRLLSKNINGKETPGSSSIRLSTSRNSKLRKSARNDQSYLHSIDLNIDNFIKNKNLKIIDEPWSLTNNVTGTNRTHLNAPTTDGDDATKKETQNKQFDISKTENLIDKLKKLFRNKYRTKYGSISYKRKSLLGTLEQQTSLTKSNNENVNLPPANVQLSSSYNQTHKKSITSNDNLLDNLVNNLNRSNSIYLKKLRNNYYDRKLWNTLLINNNNNNNEMPDDFNFYAEKSVRDYNSEFTVLRQQDWSCSEFAKYLTLYSNFFTNASSTASPDISVHDDLANKNLPEISNSSQTIPKTTNNNDLTLNRELTETKLTTLQKAIIVKNDQVRSKNLDSILNFLPSIKNWSNIKKHTLLLVLIENDSKTILEFLKNTIKNKVQPIKSTIDHLPDNVLLKIFSYLNVKTLERVELVCNRWNYLANTPELWVYKCKKLGERENLGQIEALLVEDLAKDEDIDWKMAFIELKEFVKELKSKYLEKLNEINQPSPIEETPANLSRALSQRTFRTFGTLESSYVNFYEKSKNVPTLSKRIDFVETNREDEERDEDLVYSSSNEDNEETNEKTKSATNNNTQQSPNTPKKASNHSSANSKLSFTKSSLDVRKSNELTSIKENRVNTAFEFGQVSKSSSVLRKSNDKKYFKEKTLNQITKTSNKNYEPERVHDFKEIKMELQPTKDLLNNIVPNYRLKWKVENEDIRPNEKVIYNLNPVIKVLSLNNHKDSITCIDYDKKRLVTGGLDRMIFIYDFKEGSCLGKLEGHKGGIRCLQILKNRLCSGSWDMTVIIWNMFRFEKVICLRTNEDTVSCIYFDMDYLMYGSHDKSINIWRFNENYIEKYKTESDEKEIINESDVVNFVKTVKHSKSAITCLTYDGISCIVSANAEGVILLMDIDGNLLKELTFNRNYEPITSVKLVGALIISSTEKGRVLFWNRYSNKCESIIQCNENEMAVNSVAFYAQRFYTAGKDSLIKEWDLGTFTCTRQFKAHNGPVLDLIVAENRVISCGADRAIIWDMNIYRNQLFKRLA